ncbi:hypothetical protein IAD21_05588 [Abditibacteriota bacterium]|nr:hypothetical protein IAD21_05588 [Abditibacteriota bacterium]
MTGQDYAVFAIVAGAAIYLVRHWILTAKGEGGCCKCSGGNGCATKAKAKPAEPQLVQIDLGGSWKRD